MLCAKFGWNWPSGSRVEDFLISSIYYYSATITTSQSFLAELRNCISPMKREGTFIWTNLNSLHSIKDALCQVWLKLAYWFSRRCQNFVNEFSPFFIFSPWKSKWPFIWTNDSPSPNHALCQVWLILAQGFWRIFFLILSTKFCDLLLSPLEKEFKWPFILRKLNLIHPRMLCAKFGWNWCSGSGEDDENVKSLHRQIGQTKDDRQSRKRTNVLDQLKTKIYPG